MARRADLEIHVRRRNAEVAEEPPRHRVIVVLSGMDDELLDPAPDARAIHGSELGKIRPGAYDVKEIS
jgi:hypothetical protein